MILSQLLAVLSLVPWLLMAGFSLMAFDSGVTAEAWAIVIEVWAYPILRHRGVDRIREAQEHPCCNTFRLFFCAAAFMYTRCLAREHVVVRSQRRAGRLQTITSPTDGLPRPFCFELSVT